jgi:ATP-dependent protease HslVU (ClpYQ) peptidase subunit
MTTVIAVRKNDGVLIGSDTQVSFSSIFNTSIHKKFISSDKVVIGIAGMGNALSWIAENIQSFPDIPVEAYTSKDIWFSFLNTQVISWLRNYEGLSESEFIIAIKGQVAFIDGYNKYIEVPNGNVVGIGSGWTKAASYVKVHKVRTKKELQKVLKFTAETDNFTSAPFVIEHIKLD